MKKKTLQQVLGLAMLATVIGCASAESDKTSKDTVPTVAPAPMDTNSVQKMPTDTGKIDTSHRNEGRINPPPPPPANN